MVDKDKCDCENGCCEVENKKWWKHHGKKVYKGGGGGGIWFAGFIGALFYFLQNTQGFVPILIGIFKAMFWPAFLVFKALELLKV
jgi:hypothetical protein